LVISKWRGEKGENKGGEGKGTDREKRGGARPPNILA